MLQTAHYKTIPEIINENRTLSNQITWLRFALKLQNEKIKRLETENRRLKQNSPFTFTWTEGQDG